MTTTPVDSRLVGSQAHTRAETTVIDLGSLRTVLTRGLLLLGEVVIVPGLLLYGLVAAGHPMLGLVVVFGWRAACIASRRRAGAAVPATCWLTFGLFLARTVAGLAVSSVSVYLFVPVALCAMQGLVFLGSAFAPRPILMRLAADYADEIPDRPAMRRLFAQLSGIWGGAHLACACAGVWALTLPPAHAVAATSLLALACTITSVGGCVGWGLWRVSRIPGLHIAFGRKRTVPFAAGAAQEAVPLAEAA